MAFNSSKEKMVCHRSTAVCTTNPISLRAVNLQIAVIVTSINNKMLIIFILDYTFETGASTQCPFPAFPPWPGSSRRGYACHRTSYPLLSRRRFDSQRR